MKLFACLFFASVLVVFTAAFTKATVSQDLITAARLKFERVIGRQIVPSLTLGSEDQLQTSFELKLGLLRATNAMLSKQDCLEAKKEAVMAAAIVFYDACDIRYEG